MYDSFGDIARFPARMNWPSGTWAPGWSPGDSSQYPTTIPQNPYAQTSLGESFWDRIKKIGFEQAKEAARKIAGATGEQFADTDIGREVIDAAAEKRAKELAGQAFDVGKWIVPAGIATVAFLALR